MQWAKGAGNGTAFYGGHETEPNIGAGGSVKAFVRGARVP